MATTRPATVNPEHEDRSSRPLVKDLTFLLGPPTDPEKAREVADAATASGMTPDEAWTEVVRDSMNQLLEPDSSCRGMFDRIVTSAVKEKVTVWGVREALHFQCGRQIPGLTITVSQILGSGGGPVDRDFTDEELQRKIGSHLMQHTRADWVTCITCYVSDELGFPSFANHRKEA